MRKRISIVLILIGLIVIGISVVWTITALGKILSSASVGIIGGLDRPTFWFVLRVLTPEISKTIPFRLGVLGVLMILVGMVVALVKKKDDI